MGRIGFEPTSGMDDLQSSERTKHAHPTQGLFIYLDIYRILGKPVISQLKSGKQAPATEAI